MNVDPRGLTILLAESDPYLADVSVRFLETHGVRTTIVADGTLVARELDRSTYACLVLRSNVARCNGLDVCKQTRASMPTLPIIVIGDGGANERVLSLLAGADDYLRRPYSSRDLIERILVIVRRRRSAFPLISSR